MKVEEARRRLMKVNNLFDFQKLFSSADFEIVYKVSENNYSKNSADKRYNRLGSCINSFMMLEDGYIEYPF